MTGIPKNERVWERITTSANKKYIITSSADRSTYYIYIVNADKAKKLGKDPSPKVLEAKWAK